MNPIIEKVRRIAIENGVDPDLAQAIAQVESNFDPLAVRFEPKWSCFLNVEKYAMLNRITELTEKALQSMSYGVMQCMGGVVRELGFEGPLSELLKDDELAIKYGVLKLKGCVKRWTPEHAAIAAYNGGSPRKLDGGMYVNQRYVNLVRDELKKLRLN